MPRSRVVMTRLEDTKLESIIIRDVDVTVKEENVSFEGVARIGAN